MTIEAKINEFKKQLETLYPSDFEEIIQELSKDIPKVFRIIKKENTEEILKDLQDQGFVIEKTEFKDCFYVVSNDQSKKLSSTQQFNESGIYIQEIASTLPVRVLNPQKNEKVLDMCASPGSKTIQMCNFLNNEANSNVFAIEKDPKRFSELKKNLEKYFIKDTNLFKEDAKHFSKVYPQFNNYFDKILLDAPCSNENKLNFADLKYFQFWSPKKSRLVSKLQKGLIQAAFHLLKPGGTLIYSTCTYSIYENELVLDYLLRKNSNAEIVEIEELDLVPLQNRVDGLIEWKENKLDGAINKAVRIIPGGIYRGFFVAKITKI